MTLLPDITGSANATAATVTAPSGTYVQAFYLTNTHATQTLYWAGGTATTSSTPLLPGKSVYINASLMPPAGISLIASGASTTYVIAPLG